MYEKNGEFGSVDIATHRAETCLSESIFTFTIAGWHECNDLYRIVRTGAQKTIMKEYLLLVTVSGEGVLETDEVKVELKKNMIALVDVNKNHTYYTKRQRTWEFYFLHFKGPNMSELCGYLENVDSLVQKMPSVYRWVNHIKMIMDIKKYSLNNVDFKCTPLIANMVYGLLEMENETYADDSILVEITQFMMKNYSHKFVLQDIVDEFYVSKNYICALFKKHNLTSPYAYLIKIRIEESKKMLLIHNESVAQVAVQCGFTTPNNYIFTFKKYEGITPKQFKKQFKV